MFSVAIASQLFQIIFINVVEIPHMRRLYPKKFRADGPHTKFQKKQLERIGGNKLKKFDSFKKTLERVNLLGIDLSI